MRPAPGSLTYESYYGLNEKPFSLAADPRFLFRCPSHERAFARLLTGIRRREGLIVLSGEVGTGKTTLCRAVLGSLDRRTFSAFIPDPFVSREDLLKMLLVDFGVVSVDDLKRGRLNGASRPDLSYPLYEFLSALVPLQAFAVLIIDEAQNLPLPLLEEIRILSDLEGSEKLLQVVLIGQPELQSNLKLPQMRQVDQRVSVRCELAPLPRVELDGYVRHRLDVASGGTCRGVQFTTAALDAIHCASSGVPRVINRISDEALNQGWLKRSTTIDADIVSAALDDLGFSKSTLADKTVATVSLAEPRASAPSIVAMLNPVATEDDANATVEFDSEASPRPVSKGRTISVSVAAGVVLFVLVSATFGVTSWLLLKQGSLASTMPLPTLPVAPRHSIQMPTAPLVPASEAMPASLQPGRTAFGGYVIHVASFESGERAALLVTQLAETGYQAYYADFDLHGRHFWQVIVGEYASVADAQADLEKIRSMPAYADARLRPSDR